MQHNYAVHVHVQPVLYPVDTGQSWTSQYINKRGFRQRRVIIKFDPEAWLVYYTEDYSDIIKTCRGESFDRWVRKWHALTNELWDKYRE